MKKRYSSLILAAAMTGALMTPMTAQAKHHWDDYDGHAHYDHGHHYGWRNGHREFYPDDAPLLDWKTGKILKGGLLGAGIGAATGVVLNKPLAKTTLIGAGIGSGTQAVRYSDYMRRHPIVKTAAYGTMAGVGASQLTREGSLKKGALWGAGIGTGLGILKQSD